MDHRGHPRTDSSGRHSHRTRDREDHHRYPQQQDRDQGYPPQNPRDRDRYWAQTDPRYRTPFSSPPPPVRPEPYHHGSQQYHYGYGPPEHHRPQSRHGYDYPPHSLWDYRDTYSYYEQDYYRGQHGRQDAQWAPPHDSYSDRGHKQERSGSVYADEYRYDAGRDASQHHLNDYEDNNPSRDNEELSSFYLGTLERSKTSGLSSSSYELSQYINGAEHSESVPQSLNAAEPEVSAPLKYSIPHVVVSFGPAGQLIRVTPGLSTQENVSQLEVHSLEVILGETKEQQEMRNFPGPLAREDLHKVDAIEFAQQRAASCRRDDELLDRSSAALLWNLLILLCRQNGQIVGSDLAELLVQDSRSDTSWEAEAPTLIDFSEGTTAEAPPHTGDDDLLTGDVGSFSSESSQKALQSYTKLLLAGRKKEALESAMSSGLWGHALFLASKMDGRSYTFVLNRFTGQLTASDPLQTLFHLLTGRVPAVAMCCGNEKYGDWRPHLAVMLSNETADPGVQRKAVVTMGDTLASRGLIHAAQVCYLTAGVPFGAFTQKAERLVLLGSSHRQSFEHFATNLAIQCTELYEYCQTLSSKNLLIPAFQVYKFLYASRLLDCGLTAQAFHYCEVVGRAVLRQREPCFVLTAEVIKLSDRLRHSEGQFSDAGVSGAEQEPEWLQQLRARLHSLQTGSYDCTEHDQLRPASAHEDEKESDLEELTRDLQSPEPELLYYSGPEQQVEALAEGMNSLSWDVSGAQDWPPASRPVPVPLVYSPPVATVAAGQHFSYHNTDTAAVTTASPHCSPSAEGAGPSSAAAVATGVQMMDVGFGQTEQSQQSVPHAAEASEQTDGPHKESTKAGWFSGWFKSKAKDQQQSSEQRSPAAQMEPPPPPPASRPPPPPAVVSPGMFPSQPSSAGINPFSRKAGQQLG